VDFRGFDKETGRGWSCLQDSLAMAGKLLGMDIKEELYKFRPLRPALFDLDVFYE